MAQLKLLGSAGHTTLAYDVTDEASLVAAGAEFQAQMNAGQVAFAVKAPGQPAERIAQFDPLAEEILIMAPMAGGAR